MEVMKIFSMTSISGEAFVLPIFHAPSLTFG